VYPFTKLRRLWDVLEVPKDWQEAMIKKIAMSVAAGCKHSPSEADDCLYCLVDRQLKFHAAETKAEVREKT
jgi:hypothetical protein